MIQMLRKNTTIKAFCTNDLVPNQEYRKKWPLLMSNFSFLLKLSISQVIVVSTATWPVVGCCMAMLLELLYITVNFFSYLNHKHIRSVFLLIPRLTQSLILFAIESLLLLSYSNLETSHQALSSSRQNTIIWIIAGANFAEYLFLLLNLFVIVKSLVSDYRRKKVDPAFKK